MPGLDCWDPLEGPCGTFDVHALSLDDPVPSLGPGCLVSWPQQRPLEPLPPQACLEIRCEDPLQFRPQFAEDRPWSLFLEYLQPGRNDDLALLEPVLEWSQQHGCRLVVAPGLPVVGGEHARYRLYTLIRMLCDRFRLKFSLFEATELPKSERLNHYLASQRGCCRRFLTSPTVL